MQAGLVVVGPDLDGLLGQDRSDVDLLGGDVHRAAGDLHAVVEGVAHRVPPGERRQQRRVGVDDAPREGGERRGRQDRAPAGHGDQLDALDAEHVEDPVGVAGTVETGAEVGALDPFVAQPVALRDLFDGAGTVDHHDGDRQACVGHRVEEGSAARGQHGKSHRRGTYQPHHDPPAAEK